MAGLDRVQRQRESLTMHGSMGLSPMLPSAKRLSRRCVWRAAYFYRTAPPTTPDFFSSRPATQAGTGLTTRDEGPCRER